MEYTTSFKLDLNPRGAPPVVRVKQGDGYSRFLQVQLTKDGVNFTPESGVDFLFRCAKPDGHGVLEDSVNKDEELDRYLVINQGGGVIQIELVDQVATAAGFCRCDLCLFKDEQVLSTIPFVIEVVASPDIATLAVSTDDFRALIDAIERAEQLIDGVLQNVTTLSIPSSGWSGNDPYTHAVSVSGYTVTGKTKIDLAANAEVMAHMTSRGISALFIVNNNGTLTLYAIGGTPGSTLSVQASVYETTEI